MSPRVNQGFSHSPGGRRTVIDAGNNRFNDVACGLCAKPVPDGGAHIIVNYRYAGGHQLFCPECCPCRLKPETVVPFGVARTQAS